MQKPVNMLFDKIEKGDDGKVKSLFNARVFIRG